MEPAPVTPDAFPLRDVGPAGFPFDAPPVRGLRDTWATVKSGLDFFAHNLPFAHRVLERLNPYPAPWARVVLNGHGGAALAGVFAEGEPGGPAVLFAPGTFQTKDDSERKRRALDLWRRLGAHVLVLDLRGFGGSHEHMGTAGILESQDLHLAADWLRQRVGSERVTLWGESLGGATALLAGTLDGAEGRFDRIVAWSPYGELKDALRIASAYHPRGRTLAGRAYRSLLRIRLGNAAKDFDEYFAWQAGVLGMTVEELVHAASPIHHVARLRVPTFVYHAEDDRIVPVRHARLLSEVNAEHLHVEIVPRGEHLVFDRHAPVWYASVTAYHVRRAEGAS